MSKSKNATKTKSKSKSKSAASTRSQAGKSSKAKATETVAKKAKVSATTAPKAVGAIERSTYLTIHNLRQWMADEFERATKEAPTLAQFEVLNAIASADGPSQTFICRKTGMDRSTVAEVTRRLVTRGFATRQRTQQDERAYAVTLTAEGRKMHALGVDVMTSLESKLHSIAGFQAAINWATKVLDTYGVPASPAHPTYGGGTHHGANVMKGNGDGKHTTEGTRTAAAGGGSTARTASDDFDDDDTDTGTDDERVAA